MSRPRPPCRLLAIRLARTRPTTPVDLTLRVGGQRATGHYALPSKRPTGLVVFAHGYGHTSFSWKEHLKNAARRRLVAVAMDYRGITISPDANNDGLPESRGWNAMTGARDSIAAARYFDARCPSVKRVGIMGVSMGGNISGLAVALSKGLFDYWVDVEGAVNMTETYLEARAAAGANETAKNAYADIEAETGGPIEEDPEPYLERTVVARVDDIKASGLAGVVVVHAIDDGLVPYNQSRELAALLKAENIPTDFYTVSRRSPESERETTLSGHVVGRLDPNYTSPLAGHASEKSQTHIVMVTAFERLWSLMRGRAPGPYNEYHVDGGA